MTTENALSTRIWLHILLLNWYLVASLNVKVSFLIVKAGCLIGYSPSIFLKKVAFIDGNVSGTHKAQIGEVGLAHGGILFFDELPHFSKTVLEALREPLEDRHIRISRVNAKVTYDADFLFVAAMNPCPCGNLFSTTTPCRCSDTEIARYRARLSDPFLDRIDLYVQMHPIDAEDKPGLPSREFHARVREAFLRQKRRGQHRLNGSLSDEEVARHCILGVESQQVVDQAIGRFGLSFRAVTRLLKVARTIADLEGSDDIQKPHLLEALSYRRRS